MEEITDLTGYDWIRKELQQLNETLKKIAEELQKISKSLYALRMQKGGSSRWRKQGGYW